MRLLFFCLLCAGLSAIRPAAASTDDDFLAARDAYGRNRIAQFERFAHRVPTSYPLHFYLDYWHLKTVNASPEAMVQFASEHGDSPLSARAYQDLARYYGSKEDWDHFRPVAAKLSAKNTELTCYDLRARLARGNQAAVGEGLRIWLTAQDLPSSCDPLFASLAQTGFLTDGIRAARLRLALEAGNLGVSKALIRTLSKDEQADLANLDLARKTPDKVLMQPPTDETGREITFYALSRLARSDLDRAADLWRSKQETFVESDRHYGWGVIALAAARQLDPAAVNWFLAAKDQLSDTQNLWKARTMIRAGRWPDVYRSIADMPPDMQDDAVWRYWRARALEGMNLTTRAYPIFADLSHEMHYYGLLASEELPSRVENQPADYRPSPQEIDEVKSEPGIRRALLLHKLSLNTDAANEWSWATRNFDDHQLLAAAEVARQAQWYDRAIRTAEQTRTTHSLDLRYLTPYRDLAESYAHKNDLDPALVYGLMRQESRFMDYARSSVGARGLMQIMPATARWIARHMGLGRKAHARYADPDVNIKFGTYYLKSLLTSFDNSAVLATAGYNAGPGRSRKWQADKPLEGAVYVESIPIPETREYVKKVLANAMFYSQRLGLQGDTLKERLGIIPARTSTVPPGQEKDPDPDTSD